PEILRDDRHVHRALAQVRGDPVLEHAAQVELGQPDVAVLVALHGTERFEVELLGEPLREDRDPVVAPVHAALDDRALEHGGEAAGAVGRARGVRAGGADDRAAVEVDPRQLVDRELGHVLDVALDEPFESVVAAQHARAVVPRLDRRRRDHRVDPGGRAPADEDGECLHGLIVPATRKWSWPSGVRTTSSPSAGWTPVRAPMLSWWVTSTRVPVAGRAET